MRATLKTGLPVPVSVESYHAAKIVAVAPIIVVIGGFHLALAIGISMINWQTCLFG